MSILTRILYAWIPALQPVPPPPPARPRRRRDTCPFCGKRLAIITSTGTFWHHKCEPLDSVDRDALVPSDAGMEGRR